MKSNIFIRQSILFGVCIFLFTSCPSCSQPAGISDGVKSEGANLIREVQAHKNNVTLKIVSWNVETFFDSVKTGEEYSEFQSSKNWGTEKYVERLKKLTSTIKNLDADVFVMEELENEGQLYDISNYLAGEWNMKKNYSYGCFAKDSGSSIGCGIISRYALSNMKCHELDVRTESEFMPSMRPIIEVTVAKDNENLVLLVNHWKSKSGGEEATEKWRDWQEAVLSKIVEANVVANNAVLACGDFNRDVNDFCKSSSENESEILLRKNISESKPSLENSVVVISPWYEENILIEPGSYYFNERWERIDNFFFAGSASCASFSPETNGAWCDSETKVPARYTIWNGYGYSDHLPISCVVQF